MKTKNLKKLLATIIAIIILPATWNMLLILNVASAILGISARLLRRAADRVEHLTEVRKELRKVTAVEYIVLF